MDEVMVLLFTLHASEAAAQCIAPVCLCPCLFVCYDDKSNQHCIDVQQTRLFDSDCDHLELIKFRDF